MEWIETTAKSVQEAKDLALDKLGVDEAEAEFEILEEPKAGLFGRVRGQGRVRARVEPKSPRAKAERGDRKRSRNRKSDDAPEPTGPEVTVAAQERSSSERAGGEGSRGGRSSGGNSRREGSGGNNRDRSVKNSEESSMEEVETAVQQFLTGLTEAFGLSAEVAIVVDDEQAIEGQVVGKHGLLLGPKGRTLDAIQELCRMHAQRVAPSSTRIRVDVGGYREARRVALASFASQAATQAVSDGVEVVLEPMSPADRKVIHDALGDFSGVTTRSAGNEPRRRVVIVPEVVGADSLDVGHDGADDESGD